MLRGARCGVCGAEECLREEEQVRDAGGRVWRRKRGLSGDTDTSSAACGQHLPLKGKAGGAARVCCGEPGAVCAARRNVCWKGNRYAMRVAKCYGRIAGLARSPQLTDEASVQH